MEEFENESTENVQIQKMCTVVFVFLSPCDWTPTQFRQKIQQNHEVYLCADTASLLVCWHSNFFDISYWSLSAKNQLDLMCKLQEITQENMFYIRIILLAILSGSFQMLYFDFARFM